MLKDYIEELQDSITDCEDRAGIREIIETIHNDTIRGIVRTAYAEGDEEYYEDYELDDLKGHINSVLSEILEGFEQKDICMCLVCGCEDAKTMGECEKNCPKFSSCDNIALANDFFKELEEM